MRRLLKFSRIGQWTIFCLFTLVAIAALAASLFLVNYLRKEEVRRINLLASAMKFQQEVEAPDPATQELVLEINRSNTSVPIIVLDKKGEPMFTRNLSPSVEADPQRIKELAAKIGEHYAPIELKFPDGNSQYVFYDNSNLLNWLRFFPYLAGAAVLLYLLFSFWFLRTLKKTDEGFLWAGLAKETAHQIGTPLSSMIGWVEIQKTLDPEPLGTRELAEDVERLRTISERFSKIGSVPELNSEDLAETVKATVGYMRSRVSKKVDLTYAATSEDFPVRHNATLISWVLENLIKNSVDAMKGSGSLRVKLYRRNRLILLEVTDTGQGMTRSQARNIFKPGFSTKKRGWGLGLSLAKRVIETYHNGEIKVAHTELKRGTTIRISFKA